MRYLRLCILALALAAVAVVAPDGPGAPVATAAPATFHCGLDASCPEVLIGGDPHAALGPGPAPFRGYGDPSLERDPVTGTLWLSYSWLDVLVSDPGPPAQIDFGVRTHLARSDDDGASFTFVRSVNETLPLSHPDSGDPGWTIHEVSTLAREASGGWQMLWLTYFEALGEPPPGSPDDRSDFHYVRSLAASPQELGDNSDAWIRGTGTSPSFGAVHDLSALPQLADCVAFTEPALFSHEGATYLATNCVVVQGGVRRDDLERLVLLRQEAAGYSYVGTLLTAADAADLGASRFEQADLALSRSGAVLLIGTPIQNATPEHLGCVAFEVSDLASAQVARDAAGQATPLATITGEDDTIGPGLCAYDPASDTGVLMVLHVLNPDPFDLVFSLRATGVHPDVVAECAAIPAPWTVPPGDGDCDGFSTDVENHVGTDPARGCPVVVGVDDTWPTDNNLDTVATLADVLAYIAPFNQAVPPAPVRFDINRDTTITLADVLMFIPFFNKSCSP